MDLVVDYIRALDVVIIPGSHASPHGDIFIEKNIRDAPSEIYKEGVDIVNGEWTDTEGPFILYAVGLDI